MLSKLDKNNKEEPLHFENADFSTMRKIDNSSILEMLKYDEHLLDNPRICPRDLRDRFTLICTNYINAERNGIETEMDRCLIQLSNLFLGSTNDQSISDSGFMDLHLRVQRHLRNPVYRCHAMHLLGVCLFSELLLETDIDLLTLGRTKNYFFEEKEKFGVPNKPPNDQDETKPLFYPGTKDKPMDRSFYPSGELFSVKLRKYLKDRKEDNLRNAYLYFFDPYVWLNLYHDWGYIYELQESYCEGIYKNNRAPKTVEPILDDINNRKDQTGFNLDQYVKNEDDKRNDVLDYILALPLCVDDERKNNIQNVLKEIAIKNFNANKPNHGVVSSFILYDKFLPVLKDLEVAVEIPDDVEDYKDKFLVDELGAICLHDLNLEGLRLSLTDSPHFFILKFADTISDWGRIHRGISMYDFSVLDHVLYGYNRMQCTNSNGDPYADDDRGILVNILFDFSNNERLLSGEIGSKVRKDVVYPSKETYEFEEFKRKKEELQSLDYQINSGNESYQWFFFNLILIDRYGERFLIENSKNNVDLWWIIPPLFRFKLGDKKFSWFNDGNFQHETK